MENIIAYKVEAWENREVEINNSIDGVISVHCSASSIAKFLKKNEVVVATLFNTSKNLQAEYTIPFSCRYKGDNISIIFINRDIIPMDMYATFQTYEEPRII